MARAAAFGLRNRTRHVVLSRREKIQEESTVESQKLRGTCYLRSTTCCGPCPWRLLLTTRASLQVVNLSSSVTRQ